MPFRVHSRSPSSDELWILNSHAGSMAPDGLTRVVP